MSKRKAIGRATIEGWTLVVLDDGSARVEKDGEMSVTSLFPGKRGERAGKIHLR